MVLYASIFGVYIMGDVSAVNFQSDLWPSCPSMPLFGYATVIRPLGHYSGINDAPLNTGDYTRNGKDFFSLGPLHELPDCRPPSYAFPSAPQDRKAVENYSNVNDGAKEKSGSTGATKKSPVGSLAANVAAALFGNESPDNSKDMRCSFMPGPACPTHGMSRSSKDLLLN